MSKIILASNNIHKIKEFKKILEKENIELIPQSSLGIPDIPETVITEKFNIKSKNASLLEKPAIVDDSGRSRCLSGDLEFIQQDTLARNVMLRK